MNSPRSVAELGISDDSHRHQFGFLQLAARHRHVPADSDESTALIDPNGIDKSTLPRIIDRLLTALLGAP